ncbi:phage tail tube protein [Malikia spinosa]|uniref:phage tail tube protein n=1 Tax=Malikia spinosa TaxID=86180 RepID=UPI002FDA7D77
MTINTNSGLVMAMQSAIAAAKTITAITKAAPGVVSSTAHGFANGDFVLLEIEGMVELNKCVYEVGSIATDTFQLIGPDGATGLDTTLFSTFSSGTAKKLTLGTSITGVQNFAASGGDIKFLDSTTVHDTKDKQIASGVSAMSYNLTIQWDPANAGQSAMRAAFDIRAPKAMRITWPNGAYVAWYGSVGYNGAPGGDSQGITTTQAALAAEGNMTVAA